MRSSYFLVLFLAVLLIGLVSSASTIDVNTPIDDYNSSLSSVDFNASVYTDVSNLTNVSLYIGGVLNQTNSSGTNNTDYIFSVNLSDGTYSWFYGACDDSVSCSNSTSRTLTIDTIFPNLIFSTITVAYHNGTNYIISPGNQDGVSDNITVDLEYSEEVSAEIYIVNSTGDFIESIYSSASVTNPEEYAWSGLGFNEGLYNVRTNITDSSGNNNDTLVAEVFIDNTLPSLSSFDSLPVTVSSSDDVQVNVTVSDSTGISNVILELDNATNYTVSTSSGDEYYYTIGSGNYSSGDVFTYRWYAEDSVGNLDVSSEQSFSVENSAPTIDSYSPGDLTPVVGTGENQIFSVVASDSDTDDTISYEWFVDGISESTSGNSFTHSESSEGNYNVLVNVSDSSGLYDTQSWTFIVSDEPLVTNFTGSDTTDLNSVADISAVENFTLENSEGKLEFLNEVIDLSNALDLNDNVVIENGILAVNTSRYPELNRSATITLTGLDYDTIPEIYFNDGFTTDSDDFSEVCDFCNVTSYTESPTNDGTVTFTVEHFTSFMVGESGDDFDLSLFDNLDFCSSGENGNLSIDVSKPDEDDEFEVGDLIDIEAEVTNDGESKDVVLEVILYNIDEDDEESDERSSDERIGEGDSDEFELSLEIPENFNEDDDYIVYFKAYEDNNEDEECVEGAFSIDLVRDEDDVVINNVFVSPTLVSSGGNFEVLVEVENRGSEDKDDVYVTVSNPSLGISARSQEFEVERAGDDDFVVESISVDVPSDAEGGEYDLRIQVFYDGGRDEVVETFSVLESIFLVNGNLDSVYSQAETENQAVNQNPTSSNAFSDEELLIILIDFVLMTFILVILISILSLRGPRRPRRRGNDENYKMKTYVEGKNNYSDYGDISVY